MRYTRHNIYCHELIGLPIEVKDHTDPTLRGIKGVVVNETMKMLIVSTGTREVMIPKHGGVFIFKPPKTKGIEVLGDLIIGRPEDRLKRFGRLCRP